MRNAFGASQPQLTFCCSAHFALAVVVDPWACLDMNGTKNTTVLYLDSMHEHTPLATDMLFAKLIVEWDTARQGKGIGEPVDVLIEGVTSRISFESVKVKQCHG